MEFLSNRGKYVKLYEKYKNMKKTERDIENAHYQCQKDIFPAAGLYITIGLMASMAILKDVKPMIVVIEDKTIISTIVDIMTGSILGEKWGFVIPVSYLALVTYLILTVKNASIHLSVIKDIEKKEEKSKEKPQCIYRLLKRVRNK